MKKVIISILAILYLTTSTGAIVQMHYCMGKFISWGLESTVDHTKCSKCSMKKKNACCGDKKLLIKAEKDQKLTQTNFEFSNSFSEIDNQYNRFPELKIGIRAYIPPTICVYPLGNKTPLFILNGVFRI